MKRTIYDFDENMSSKFQENLDLEYFNAKDETKFSVFGTRAKDDEGYFRFDESQRALILPTSEAVSWLSCHSSGIQIKFLTDADDIFVKVKLNEKFNMTNMTAIGQCCVDLYVADEGETNYVFHGVARCKFDSPDCCERLGDFRKLGKKMRRCVLNLPLYSGVLQLEIGVNKGAFIKPDSFANDKVIAVYGTSITQGCCASHTGMAYTNILSRRLDCEFLNYGFSGSALNEPVIADVLKKIPFDLLILDTEPNAGVDKKLYDNLQEFLDRFLSVRPKTPVILLSRMPFSLDLYDPDRVNLNKFYKGFMRSVAKKYAKKGYDVRFYDQSRVFGKDFSEYTVDGVHPTDLGMVKIADFYEKILKKISLGT